MKTKSFSSKDAQGLPFTSYLKALSGSFSTMEPINTGISSSFPAKPFPIKAILVDIYGTLLISEAGDIGLSAMNENEESPSILFNGKIRIERPYKDIRNILHDRIKVNHTEIKKKNPAIQFPEIDIISIWEQVYTALDIRTFTIEDIVRTALHFEIQTNKVWLMPHAQSLLSELSAINIPVGIVSNAQFYTPVFLEYLLKADLKDYKIDEEISSWSYKKQIGKPDLNIFKDPIDQIRAKYDIAPSEILYIGNDMLNDIFSAASCGLKTALFAGDKRSLRLRKNNPQVSQIQPDCIITDLIQILPFLRETKQ